MASNKLLCEDILDFPKSHHTCDKELDHFGLHVSRGESLGKPYELLWGMEVQDYMNWDNAEILKRKTDS